jgi:hypothetical protein
MNELTQPGSFFHFLLAYVLALGDDHSKMSIIEEALEEKIQKLEADLHALRQELARIRSQKKAHGDLHPANTMSLNALIREAISRAPARFSTTDIRQYVRQRKPQANPDSLNTAIIRILEDTAKQVEKGKGGKPSIYEKLAA